MCEPCYHAYWVKQRWARAAEAPGGQRVDLSQQKYQQELSAQRISLARIVQMLESKPFSPVALPPARLEMILKELNAAHRILDDLKYAQ